jgi:hypothetical protein
MTERRASERFDVEITAEISCCASGRQGKCVLRNISKGGAFVGNAPGLKLGERVELELETGMVFVGNLVRNSDLCESQPGFAVKFVPRGVLMREGKPVLLQSG